MIHMDMSSLPGDIFSRRAVVVRGQSRSTSPTLPGGCASTVAWHAAPAIGRART